MEDLRIHPPKSMTALLDTLTTAQRPDEDPLFAKKYKVMLFAAALGKKIGNRTPIKKRGIDIRLSIFINDEKDDGFIDALAVAEKNDLGILEESKASVEKRILIFEEYAHTGLLEMEKLYKKYGDALETFIEECLSAAEQAEDIDGYDPSDYADVLKGL